MCVSSSLTSYDGSSDACTSSTSAAKLSYCRGGVCPPLVQLGFHIAGEVCVLH